MFGILGTAGISIKSIVPVVQTSEHKATTIASCDEARANIVADELGILTAYGSYEALSADDSLGAVCTSFPNSSHADWVHVAADCGLHVLCEKLLIADADEMAAVFDYYEDTGVTLMEAFMYRFHPLTERAVEPVASEFGVVVSVTPNFPFYLLDGTSNTRIDPDLVGGSIMGVGCYAASATWLFLGAPDRVHATTADTCDCGVDARMSGILKYDSDAIAHTKLSFDTPEAQYYRVQAIDGRLEADPALNVDLTAVAELTYATGGHVVTEMFDPTDSYCREVEAFTHTVKADEAPRVDREESASVMRTTDTVYESAETGAAVELD